MLNDFLDSVKDGLMNQLSEKTDLDSVKLNGVTDVVTDTVKDGLLNKFKSGQLGDIVGLLKTGGNSTPFAGVLVNNTVTNLASKLGLPKTVSNSVASIAVPFIINKLGSFASSKGKAGEDGVSDLLGDLVKGSMKDNLLGGLGKKFGF